MVNYEKMKGKVLDEMKKHFRPEFLNRIDEQIVFRPLSKEDLAKIVDLMVSDVNDRLMEKGLSIAINKKVKEFLVDKGYEPSFGARPLRRVIEDNIEDPLSEQLLLGKFLYGTKIKADVKDGKIEFTGSRSARSERSPEDQKPAAVQLRKEKDLQKKA
jgi:ATP-dependent Clp protease ATP-binding subunit ClpC